MNFLFCINNKYCDVIKPVIYSILEHNSGNHCFYFIYADVSDYNQQKIISYTESLGCLAVFRKFDKDIRCLPINGNNWSVEVYFRLFACYLLHDVDKVLYLDGDIICTGGATGLYQMNDILCAVENDDQSACCRLNLPKGQRYYNAGVLMMNLQKMRDLYSEDAILTDLFELKDRLLFQDQDFINVKYGGVIRSVSKVYNYMISVAEVNQNYSKESSPILIHYVMEKPWKIKFPYKTDYPYFKLMWRLGRKMELVKLYILHRLYRIYQLTLVSKEGRKI